MKVKNSYKALKEKMYEKRFRFEKAVIAAITSFCGIQATGYAAFDLGEGADFFNSAIDCLKILVIALGIGLGAWGVVNLLEGYGNDNPGAKSQGMKQLMAGAGIAVVGAVLIPQISGLWA